MARKPVDETLFTTETFIKRNEKPVLTRFDCPYNAALTFNAGVVKKENEYIMLFRNDYGDYEKQRLDGTHIGLAKSADGLNYCFRAVQHLKMKERRCVFITEPPIRL